MRALLPGRLVETEWQVPAEAAIRALGGERLELIDTGLTQRSRSLTQHRTSKPPFACLNFRHSFISV
jgi:hypothetical protein